MGFHFQYDVARPFTLSCIDLEVYFSSDMNTFSFSICTNRHFHKRIHKYFHRLYSTHYFFSIRIDPSEIVTIHILNVLKMFS